MRSWLVNVIILLMIGSVIALGTALIWPKLGVMAYLLLMFLAGRVARAEPGDSAPRPIITTAPLVALLVVAIWVGLPLLLHQIGILIPVPYAIVGQDGPRDIAAALARMVPALAVNYALALLLVTLGMLPPRRRDGA